MSQRKGSTTKEFSSLHVVEKNIDKYILITYRFSDRKFSQPIIRTSDLPQK